MRLEGIHKRCEVEKSSEKEGKALGWMWYHLAILLVGCIEGVGKAREERTGPGSATYLKGVGFGEVRNGIGVKKGRVM